MPRSSSSSSGSRGRSTSKSITEELQRNNYYFIYSVDLPGGAAADKTTPIKIENKGIEAGHVFVTLVQFDTETGEIIRYSFGLYPAESGYMFGSNVQGKVVDDSNRHSDENFVIPITAEGYKAALDYSLRKKIYPPKYKLALR